MKVIRHVSACTTLDALAMLTAGNPWMLDTP